MDYLVIQDSGRNKWEESVFASLYIYLVAVSSSNFKSPGPVWGKYTRDKEKGRRLGEESQLLGQ